MNIRDEKEIPWTEAKRETVLLMIEDWIQQHGVNHGENVQQCDEPAIDAVNIMQI